MNRTNQISANIVPHVIVVFLLASLMTSKSYAQTCVGSSPRICVDFINGGNPEFFNDFNVIGDDLILIAGAENWRVWSQVGEEDTTPTSFGDITLNPSVDGDDFKVEILNGFTNGPGAVNVGSMVLDGAANPNWIGFSSIASGSRITGTLSGDLTVVQDGSSNGGEVDFEIEGDSQGSITIPLVSVLVIGGNASGALQIGEIVGTNHLIACLEPRNGCLLIEGNLSADLDVTTGMEGANLKVLGSVASTVEVHIADFIGVPTTGSFVELNVNEAGDFAGDLVLDNGIPYGAIVHISGDSTPSASIDLNGEDLAGQLRLGDDSSASILDGGVLSGLVELSHGAGNAFSGSASFDSVSTGTIRTADGAQFNGTVTLAGTMAGMFTTACASGDIVISGNLSGDIQICGDLTGDIEVSGDITSTGSVTVGGALAAPALAGAGRILVSGMCYGDIGIGEQTDSLTLIHLLGGLDTNAAVEINTSGGIFNAVGAINVGPATPPDPLNDITFDGCIRIHDNGAGAGGDLKGTITVIGCHENDDPLNICLDGGGGGENIDIQQTGCFPKADGWSCGTCP